MRVWLIVAALMAIPAPLAWAARPIANGYYEIQSSQDQQLFGPGGALADGPPQWIRVGRDGRKFVHFSSIVVLFPDPCGPYGSATLPGTLEGTHISPTGRFRTPDRFPGPEEFQAHGRFVTRRMIRGEYQMRQLGRDFNRGEPGCTSPLVQFTARYIGHHPPRRA